jgi:uncharacterized membrane protein
VRDDTVDASPVTAGSAGSAGSADAESVDGEPLEVEDDLVWETEEPGGIVPAAAWRVYLAFALSLAGLGISIYLTIQHFAKLPLSCPTHGFINCEKVTTSAESYFPPFSGWPHLPVAFLGLCFYAVVAVMNAPPLWRSEVRAVHAARFGLMCLGMGFALYLVSAEFLIINNICLWCSSVHLITFVLFVLVAATVPQMLRWGARDAVWDEEPDDD